MNAGMSYARLEALSGINGLATMSRIRRTFPSRVVGKSLSSGTPFSAVEFEPPVALTKLSPRFNHRAPLDFNTGVQTSDTGRRCVWRKTGHFSEMA
jgi:hypothetical protein